MFHKESSLLALSHIAVSAGHSAYASLVRQDARAEASFGAACRFKWAKKIKSET